MTAREDIAYLPTTLQVHDQLFRVVDARRTSWGIDYNGEFTATGSYTVVKKEIWHVTGRTPKGVWVEPGPLRATSNLIERRWVGFSTRSKLRLAPTLAEAYELAIRKRRYHISRIERELREAKERLRCLERDLAMLSKEGDRG